MPKVRISEVRVTHFVVAGTCPRCGDESQTDMGTCSKEELEKLSLEFWCDVCDLEWVEQYEFVLQPNELHGPPCWTSDPTPSPTQEVQVG